MRDLQMRESLLKELEALQNPESTEYNIDQWDPEDVTVAKVVEPSEGECTDDVGVSSFGPTLRHKQHNVALENDSRYRGQVVRRSQLDDDEEPEVEESSTDDYSEEQEEEEEDQAEPQKRRPVESSEEEEEEEGEGVVDYVRSFAKVDVEEQLAKAKAVQQQIKLGEQLLSSRIRFQKILTNVNQLPHSSDYFNELLAKQPDLKDAVNQCYNNVRQLMDELLALQDWLFCRNEATASLGTAQQGANGNAQPEDNDLSDIEEGEENEEAAQSTSVDLPKCRRNLSLEKYADLLETLHQAFRPYLETTLQQWFDKTRIGTVKSAHKDFSGFETNVLTQIKYILSDQTRLRKRTQLRRSDYTYIGERPAAEGEAEAANDYDEETFDDDDFYEQLLRELIASRTEDSVDPADMGRQWIKFQKLRSKRKRKTVDTKASKGRRLRFQPHSKLVSFMAPVDRCQMTEDARTELFNSLFGTSHSFAIRSNNEL